MWGQGSVVWGRRVTGYLPCLPWGRRYQLLPSHRASPADLEGPEPQGGQLGQMHPGVGGREGIWVGSTSPGTSGPKPPFLCFLLCPDLLPPPPSAGLLGQPRGPLPAGSALRTLGPSVPGVPGRPRGPWRPWAPGEPRSPGKPRSPCGRDTEEELGTEMRWGRDPPTPSGRLCGWE